MKITRFFALFLALCTVFSLCACNNGATFNDEKDPTVTGSDPTGDPTDPTAPSTPDNPGQNSQPAIDPNHPITGLRLATTALELTDLGASVALEVLTEPVGPKYDVSFVSDDPAIATVDKAGNVTAVGKGVCIITATCGNLTAQCLVTCNINITYPEPEPEPEPDPGPSYTESDLSFVSGYGGAYDATYPLSWGPIQLYNGNIPAEEVKFTSNDKSVATVDENGVVTFVGTGRAIITAKYGRWSIQFIVRITDG